MDRQTQQIDLALDRVPDLELDSDEDVSFDTNINDLIASVSTLGTSWSNERMSLKADLYTTARDLCGATTLRDVLFALTEGRIPRELVSRCLYDEEADVFSLVECAIVKQGYPDLFDEFLASQGLSRKDWEAMLYDSDGD